MDPNVKNRPQQAADDEIPVLDLHFKEKTTLPLETEVVVMTLRARERISIGFSPRRRLYRITEKARHVQAKDVTIFVPESWALFVPAE